MTGSDDGRRVTFETAGETLYVRDVLEDERLALRFDREPDPRPALTDLFALPVDRAVSFEAESVSIPAYSLVSVRESGGEFVADLTDDLTLPRGSYCFDVVGVTKAFVRAVDVEVSATGMADGGAVEIEFDGSTTVTVGGRSLHTRPEATMTVPDDPHALMTAVSALGSSIAEQSPERSWPTLRGYPPRIERGDELDVPERLETPDTGVEIAVPATYADVYRIAPLAYYLGSTVVSGTDPEIRLETGYVEPLPTEGVALERRVSEVLGTTLFLDSLARTEGYVPSERYEYEAVGGDLPFYPPNLADRSTSDRLMEYLEVDPETIGPSLPDWPTTAVLRPGPSGMELLGHLAHLLAPIRVRGSPVTGTASGPDDRGRAADPDPPIAAGTSPSLAVAEGTPSPDDAPLPTGTAALSVAGYENGLSRSRPTKGDLRVAFAADSDERARVIERAMTEPEPPDGVDAWEVSVRPTREEFRGLLADPSVGLCLCSLPTDGSRVACADGVVDVADLETVPTTTAFEHAGRVAPAAASVEVGSLGSIAVDGALGASRLRTLVGLLATATPLAASVALARVREVTDVRLAGDPSVIAVTPERAGAQGVVRIRSVSETEHAVSWRSLPSVDARVGTEYHPLFEWADTVPELIGADREGPRPLSTAEVLELVPEPDSVVDLNGTVVFERDETSEADVRRSARRALAERSTPPEDGVSVGFDEG
ncbi:hypothetical protein SAMN04488066_10855 [Halorubrum aquaticum]|uniref:Uncharacterized protein n=1 Tax=Halorubrum aquaticum TaxID=387340 RepID=A0A1I3AYT9_9EURY|nr:hypothetical protein [Halorubrum aquaticum]SFH55184.1 hypothetical protein SAMN04488066_10855 [Halorubrum aquaticum]